MARPGRPASESYQPMCCSVSQSASYSSEAGMVAAAADDDNDDEPIFSISKSSADVVMATGPPHKRDPAWSRADLRRSSSANAPSEQQAAMLQQLHPDVWQRVGGANVHPLSLPALDAAAAAAGVQRWSAGSGSTQSRSSTPDTIVWRGGASRPTSLTQDMNLAPDSPVSKLSPPATPSPFTSPLGTPTADLLASGSTQTLVPTRPEDSPASPTPPSPRSAPPRSDAPSSPLPPGSASPRLPLSAAAAADKSFAENDVLAFRFPSPQPSSVSLAEESAEAGCLLDTLITELQGPGPSPEPEGPEGDGVREETVGYLTPRSPRSPLSPALGQETGGSRVSGQKLELPWQPVDLSAWRGGGGRSPLASSLSDSRLGACCCRCNSGQGAATARRAEDGTMTSRPFLVDAEVQTASPCGSWWDLKRSTFASAMGSHSILGSPPGSRLNLKSSVGSHSNLVSPSSSMFPGNSSAGEDEEDERGRGGDDPQWDVHSASSQDLDRRRSCLKPHGEDREQLGRRSSMKQVQWDENGMTWDIHGASVDPEVLNTAIQRHLDLQSTPRPKRPSTKKKKAPKPPLLSSVVKAMTPEPKPSGGAATACAAEAGKDETAGKEEEKEEKEEDREDAEVPRRISRADAAGLKEQEEEVYGEVGAVQPKSPSAGSGHSRTRSVIRSLRPGWCGGGSRKTDP